MENVADDGYSGVLPLMGGKGYEVFNFTLDEKNPSTLELCNAALRSCWDSGKRLRAWQSILKVIRLPNILHQFFMHSSLSYFNLCTNIGLFYDQVTKTATIKRTLFLTHY